MGAGQHGYVFPFLGIFLKLLDEISRFGEKDVAQRFFYREGDGGVVDVLGGESEVDELLVGFEASEFVELFFYEVFHGFDVVVGNAFYFFDSARVVEREVEVDGAECAELDRKSVV